MQRMSSTIHQRTSSLLETPLIKHLELETLAEYTGTNQSKSENELQTVAIDQERHEPETGQPAIEKWNKRQKLTLFVVFIANVFGPAMFALQAPFYPREASKKGATPIEIGIVFGVFAFGNLVLSPIFGSLITKIGAKFLFVSGIFVGGCTAVLFGFLDQCPGRLVFVVMCIAVRLVEAVGCAASITAGPAMIMDQFPGQVGMIMGWVESCSSIGFALGPLIGGSLYHIGGFGLPFFVMGGLMLVCFVLAFLLLPTPNDAPSKKKNQGSILTLLRIPAILVVCINISLVTSSFGFLDPTLSAHIEKKVTKSTIYIGLVFMTCGVMFGLCSPIVGHVVDKKGITKPLMVVGSFIAALSFLLVGPAPFMPFDIHLWVVVVSMGMLGVGISMFEVPTFQDLLTTALTHDVPDSFETYGLISGLFNSCAFLGTFIGPLVGGTLSQHLGFAWAATTISVAIMLGVSATHLSSTFNALDAIPLIYPFVSLTGFAAFGTGLFFESKGKTILDATHK